MTELPDSLRPYLMRAVCEWCADQGLTPYLLATVDSGTRLSAHQAKGGEIVLNLSPAAVRDLHIDDYAIRCSTRFGGVAQTVSLPIGAVIALYARENGQGLFFKSPDSPVPSPVADGAEVAPAPRGTRAGERPKLRRVK